LFNLGVPWWELSLRSIAIYVALFVGLRAFGKREVGQFTLFDLVMVLLVANAVQPAMTGPDNSLLGGVIIIVTLLAVNLLVARLEVLPFFHGLLTPAPTLIIKDGQYLDANVRREGIDRDEVEMAMREHGVDEIKDVKLAVLESDGAISIVPKDANVQRTRRKVRYTRRG
jgi:uncharacterized membrane protein YcaP (DUF421 family)